MTELTKLFLSGFAVSQDDTKKISTENMMHWWLHSDSESPVDDFLTNVIPTIKTKTDNQEWNLDAYGAEKVFEVIMNQCFENTSSNGSSCILVNKIVSLAKLIIKWRSMSFLALKSQPWTTTFAPLPKDSLPRRTIHALMNQIIVRTKDYGILMEVFDVAVQVRDMAVVQAICKSIPAFQFEESCKYFIEGADDIRIEVLLKSGGKFFAALNAKHQNVQHGKRSYSLHETNSVIAFLFREITPQQWKLLRNKLKQKNFTIKQFLYALEAGNLAICKLMVEKDFPKFLENRVIYTQCLYALSNNNPTNEWMTILTHILAKCGNKKFTIDPLDAIKLLCTPFFKENKQLIIANTKWKHTINIDANIPFGLLTDRTIVQALDKAGVLEMWSKYLLRPKFKVFEFMKVDEEAVRLLGNHGLIF